MARETIGTDLMRQINDGQIEEIPSEVLAKTREEISASIEELIEVGARIRPLMVGTSQIGWVRGIHLAERKVLKRSVYDEIEFVTHLMRLGTTLTEDEIQGLSLVELRSLSRVVRKMTESDLRLYPYLHAFVTTGMSEQLWYARGTDLTSFRERHVDLLDGSRMRLLAPPDQARLWATLCNYRIQAKTRLDASFNAVLTIRPLVGKGADPLSADLKNIARSLQTDSFDPWREVIRTKPAANLDDGWAHSEDDSLEGMKRELDGMVNNDRHERVIAAFEEQERQRAELRKRQIDARVLKRQGEMDAPRGMVVMTEADVRTKFDERRRQQEQIKPVVEDEPQSSVADRLAKYR